MALEDVATADGYDIQVSLNPETKGPNPEP
jgi:hypothetical protein